jgi:hypothetical protein
MKRVLLSLALLSSSVFATAPLTSSEKNEIELLLAESASKLIYLERDCGKAIDTDKFKELAKLKAFSEGFMTIEGISWDRVKRKAHQGYGSLKIEAPVGELCEQLKADIKGSYRFLK